MGSRPGAGWVVPRRIAAVGEVTTMATALRRLLVSMRAERESRLTRVAPAVAPAAAGLPVLLVHGYLGTPACWESVVPRLHRAGVTDVFTFGYNALGSTIPLLAADVVRAAEQAMHTTRADGIQLVGHSLGGLVIRYAVQLLGLRPAADAVVTIATPHQGSPLAMVAPGAVGAQMRPRSALLHQLPPLHSTSGVRWLVVDSDHDLVVSPSMPQPTDTAWSRPQPLAALAAADAADVQYVLVRGSSHQGILRSPQTGEALVQHLIGPPRRQPAAGPVTRAAAA